MVNLPYPHSDLPAAARVTDAMSAIRVTAAALVVALIAAYLVGTVIETVSIDTKALHDLVPLDGPAAAGLFTA